MATRKAPPWVRLSSVYREKGLGGVWFGVLSKAGYRRLVLLERRLDEPVDVLAPRSDASFRPLESDDEAAFVALGQGDAAAFRQRRERGHECWGAWCSGGLRHVAWIGFREVWVEYLSCTLLLEEGVAYVYRSYTEPGYRRLGLGPASHSRCMQALQRQGCRLMLAAVLPDNPWAFPPWLRVGYRRIGVARAIGSGRTRIVRIDLGGEPATLRGWRLVPSRAHGAGGENEPA